jgi:hypothetical protein
MSKPAQNRHIVPSAVNRPNEGVILDVTIDTKLGTDGKTVTYMGSELSKAPVPDRKFTADTCSLIGLPHTLKFVFGQERIDGKGLRSAIVVQMGRNAGVNFVRSLQAMQSPSFDELVQSEKIPIEPLAPVTDEPAQALSLSANTPLAGISGYEACVDFYQASPFSMAVAARSHKLALEPVVRVALRTSLLYGLFTELRSALSSELDKISAALGENLR